MDDHPATLVALFVLALTVILFIGIGWAERPDPGGPKVQIARIEACRTLPVAERASCITPPPTPEQVRAAAAKQCTASVDDAASFGAKTDFWQQCMQDLLSHSANSS